MAAYNGLKVQVLENKSSVPNGVDQSDGASTRSSLTITTRRRFIAICRIKMLNFLILIVAKTEPNEIFRDVFVLQCVVFWLSSQS